MKKFLFTIVAGLIGLLGQGYAQYPFYDSGCSGQYTSSSFDNCCDYDCCDCNGFQGLYIGGNVGWAFHDRTWSDRDAWVDNFSTDWAIGSHTITNDGVTVGFQLGYNMLCGCALFGLEADANWADLEKSRLFSPEDIGIVGTELRLRDNLNWFGTLRGRAGITASNLLLYVTGGAAWANIEHRWSITDPATNESFSSNNVRWGVTFGTGVEWLFCSNFSVKAEGLYLKFPTRTRSEFSPAGPDNVHFDLTDALWVARIGINYNLCGLASCFY